MAHFDTLSHTPIKRDARTEYNEQTHYCRECPEEFESTTRESAHRAALIHYIREHDKATRFKRCDHFCLLRSQADEQRLGQRIYGPGARPVKLIKRVEDIMPEDDHV